MNMIEQLNETGKWWMIGKGMAKPGEPLWGCVIQEPEIDGETLAKTEGDDLALCVSLAIAELRGLRRQTR